MTTFIDFLTQPSKTASSDSKKADDTGKVTTLALNEEGGTPTPPPKTEGHEAPFTLPTSAYLGFLLDADTRNQTRPGDGHLTSWEAASQVQSYIPQLVTLRLLSQVAQGNKELASPLDQRYQTVLQKLQAGTSLLTFFPQVAAANGNPTTRNTVEASDILTTALLDGKPSQLSFKDILLTALKNWLF